MTQNLPSWMPTPPDSTTSPDPKLVNAAVIRGIREAAETARKRGVPEWQIRKASIEVLEKIRNEGTVLPPPGTKGDAVDGSARAYLGRKMKQAGDVMSLHFGNILAGRKH